MTRQDLISYCLKFPDSYEDYPFDDASSAISWTVMRHRSNRKSFAFIYERDGLKINLKCEPMEAEFLRSIYQCIHPGYHMNHTHWNTIDLSGDVPEQELFGMIQQSYTLTLPKKSFRSPNN